MLPDDASSGLVGVTLDRKYRIDELIGAGGMGAVFRAQHVGTGRLVAVKTILPRFVRSPDALERFRREARAAGKLRHPNIVNVTDFGVAEVDDGEVAYLVMEYLRGRTLGALLRETGKLDPEVVVDIVEQVALALDAAHRAGIVHRDLKPDNIWLVPGARGGLHVRVIDFGIAKLGEPGAVDEYPSSSGPTGRPTMPAARPGGDSEAASPEAIDPDQETILPTAESETVGGLGGLSNAPQVSSRDLTEVGSMLGTPDYVSPEQCFGGPVDFRSDLYSLGAVAWQALVGRPVFEGNFIELIEKHANEVPPRVDHEDPQLPESLGSAVAKSLEKEPQDRYPSARAMAGTFHHAIEGPGIILRRGAVLYLENLGAFLRISWRAATPAMLLVIPIGLLVWFTESIALLILAGGVLWGLVTARTHAAFAAVINQLRTEPFRRLDAREIFATVNRRIGVEEGAGEARSLLRLLSFYLSCELRAPTGKGDLAFQICFHEGIAPSEVKERCAELASGAKRAYDRIRLAIFASILLVPPIEGYFVFSIAALAGLPIRDAAMLAIAVAILLQPINAMLVNPLLSPAFPLLYFRARQANGEDVELVSVTGSRL